MVDDLLVVGGGPAGLGAALAAARAGARVTLVEAAPGPGGLCRTLTRDGMRYDLGGHIPFIRDEARLAWMRALLGDDMAFVPLPVASTTPDGIQPGRYLDQRPAPRTLGDGPLPVVDGDEPGTAVLERFVGAEFRDARMRTYLEKVDGVPLERIPAERVVRLMRNQDAPEGFWFPRYGIGALMDAMADAAGGAGAQLRFGDAVAAIETEDGAFRGVTLASGERLSARRGVLAVPVGLAARMLAPHAPPPDAPVVVRACAIVFVRVDGARTLTPHAWIQCDDPRVPFSRVMETRHWSDSMVTGDATVIGMECYCQADADDPVWGLTDPALGDACVAALRDALGWLEPGRDATLLEVVRLPRAYPLADLGQVDVLRTAMGTVAAVRGAAHAPGSEVIAAVEAGERAAAAVLGPGRMRL